MTTKNAFNSIPYSTTRDNRITRSLLPETIGLDQRSLPALISEIRSIAATIPFWNEDGQSPGSWQEFLDEDILFFLVAIQEFPVEDFHEKMRTSSEEELQGNLISLVKTVDTWYRKALRLRIQSLVFELENAIESQLKFALQSIDANELPPLHRVWKIPAEYPQKPIDVQTAIDQFLQAFSYWQKLCNSLFETYVKREEISQPHAALILSFLKLYGHAQKKLNGITQQHLDHYFETLLGQTQKINEPERTFVFFNLAKEASNALIPKKTLLLGGMEDDGDEILFETLENAHVSTSTITDVMTLFVANNSLISPHNKADLITGIFQKNINDAISINPNNSAVSLFGQDGFGTDPSEAIVQSDLGWAVSGPIFILAEGERKISVDFYLEKESMSAFKVKLLTLIHRTSESKEVWINRFFSETFLLEITTSKGWLSVPKLLTTLEEESSYYKLSFSFVFTMEDPAIVSYDSELHSGFDDAIWPVLKITLDKENIYYPYSFLRDAQISKIHSKVEVKGLEHLDVYDPFAKQDISRPFALFGLQPGSQAACYIGHDEWRYKMLKSVRLSLDWHQLEHADFKSLYKQYPEKVKESSFQFDVSSLSNRQWNVSKKKLTDIPLFQRDARNQITSTSILIDDPSILKMVPDVEPKDVLLLEEAKNGYFRLRLTLPSFGFGHGIYSNLVNKIVQEITKNPKQARKKNIQIPELPYVPEAMNLQADYVAEHEFILQSKDAQRSDKRYPFELFHIHPFGLLSRANQHYTKDAALLPRFEDRGYLFLGLQNVQPLEIISLFFKLETPKTDTEVEEEISIQWESLQDGIWQPTNSTFLRYDGTDGFQKTGIMRLQIPKRIQSNHPLFDQDKVWLRVSVANHQISRLGKVVCMQMNAVEVLRREGENPESQTTLKVANAINTPYLSIPEIQSISQPFIPTGGVVTEKKAEFYTRVSERLGHKKRAVVPSDFEVLILEAFPEVYQVSCFPPSLFPEEVPPGSLQIMVLPHVYEDTPVGDRKLNAYQLGRIKKYLQQISVYPQRFHISNPRYEYIRISCAVGFHEDYEMGLALQNFTTAINRFISPWMLNRHEEKAKDEQQYILHPSSLASYLLNLPEVENISGLSMLQIHEEDGTFVFTEIKDTDSASGLKPSKPWSVFVPSTQHEITIVSPEVNLKAFSLEIGTMEIDNNFILKNTNDYEH